MVEPIAVNVISSLSSLPRHISGKSRGSLSQIVKASERPSFSSNFFTPTPRQHEKMKAVESPPLGSILDCHAWACPRSKQYLWSESGSMRSLLITELSPEPSQPSSGRRIRRTSQSSRTRLRQPKPVHFRIPEHSPRIQRHLNYSTKASTSAELKHAPFIPTSHRAKSEAKSFLPLEKLRNCLQYQSTSLENLDDLADAYGAAKEDDAFLALTPEEILELAHSLAHHIDNLCADLVLPDIIEFWGGRLLELLEYLPSTSVTSISISKDDPVKMSLISRASSFMGRFDVAERFLQSAPASKENADRRYDEPTRLAVYSFLLSMARHKGLYQCLEYLWVKNKRLGRRYFGSGDQIQALIAKNRDVLDVIEPASKWERGSCQQMFDSLVFACNTKAAFRTARDLIEAVKSRGFEISDLSVLTTCQGLASSRYDVSTAQKLFDTLPPLSIEKYTRVKLFLAGRKADPLAAKEIVETRRMENTLNEGDISNALYSLAIRGRIKEVQDMFDEYFPMDASGHRTGKPNIFHYTNAVLAHVQVGDTRGLGIWLEDMAKSGVEPNIQFFTTLISIYRQQGDVRGAFAAFEIMRTAGVEADVVTYTVLISLLSKRRDKDAADKLYMQAIEEGLVPDEIMTNCLMNAHIEAGSWREAVRIFHHLTNLPSDRQPPIDTYNSLLKGYVLVGAPFRLISQLFFRLQDIGGQPDTYTFATLIQSAVDAGQLDVATEIYAETKRRQEETGQSNLISQHILTILMSSYLRQRKMGKAKELFDEMVAKGLQPTSVTFGAIIRAYGQQAWGERMTLAEDFVKKLQIEREWERHPITKGQHLVNFYGPLLNHNAKKGDIAEVERLYSEFLDAGGKPCIAFFHYLLRSYCVVGNADKAMELWSIIRELAEGDIIDSDIPGRSLHTRMESIHVPLSVYMDILSKTGQHSEVAKTWSELQEQDFEFDSHNWNHLAVALVRAGEVERAFEILESVLLPYENANRENFRAIQLDEEEDPTLEGKLHIADGLDAPPLQPPLHNQQGRINTANASKFSFSRGKMDLLEDEEAIDADFAYPFSILQIISPNWNIWRPHNVVLRTFLVALLQLQRGYLLRPIVGGERIVDNVSSSGDNDRDPEATEALLEVLYTKYPATVERLRYFQTTEKNRLGVRVFEKIYLRR
ncbi:hypothetical protein GALMADRAFT_133376 [Galerina marginata CBS 339.88]|uniref:Pentacotripeptide-repeat region of PRORP domain-containing protein n=1 Tax=Galerina marginata (strain CBS 339.88) TaxID=685588 RepID=A0A067TY93_GALM3|nr:hypothetical protein GALMADRAFT_133376 [Galerina marginata CBS 339.88]